MAAPLKHPLPSAQMRAYLATSRQAGLAFDVAWRHAFRRIRWPHDTQHRREWKAVLIDTREEWRSGYLRAEPVTEYRIADLIDHEQRDPVAA